MIFKGPRSPEWKKKFALFPVDIHDGDFVVWLQFYERRFVRFNDPDNIITGVYETRFLEEKPHD